MGYYQTVLADNPVFCTSCDPANLVDLASGFPISAAGSPTQVAGPAAGLPTGMKMSTSADYLSVAHQAAMDITGAATLECWAYQTNYLSGILYLMAKNSGSWALTSRTTLREQLVIVNVGGGSTSNANLGNNTWQHLVVAISGTGSNIYYINGASQGSDATLTTCSSSSSAYTIGNGFIGGSQQGGMGSLGDGRMSGVALYNYQLSGAQVANHYNARNTPDDFSAVKPYGFIQRQWRFA